MKEGLTSTMALEEQTSSPRTTASEEEDDEIFRTSNPRTGNVIPSDNEAETELIQITSSEFEGLVRKFEEIKLENSELLSKLERTQRDKRIFEDEIARFEWHD